MYKVLIADDNSITRESIILTIDWGKLDCTVVADAENGITALECVKQFRPDIIITDIRMPGMDGLKLTEKIKTLYPWMKVVIITGYNEFSYAQEAIRLGAFDLILKPIDNKDICGTINKAVAVLNDAKNEQTRQDSLKSSIEKSREQIKAKMIIDIIEGVELPDTYTSIQSQRNFFIFTVGYKMNFKENNDQMFKQIIERSRYAVEHLKCEFDYDFTCFWLNNCFTIFALERGKRPLGKISEDIESICCAFINTMENLTEYSVGVSHAFSRFEDIKNAYSQSVNALECKFFFPNQKKLLTDTIKPGNFLNEYTFVKKIYDSVKCGDVDQFDQAMDQLWSMLIAETPCIPDVKNLLGSICTIALDTFIKEKGYSLNKYISRTEINSDISALDSLDLGIRYVKNFVTNLLAASGSDLQNAYSKVTQQVINYLNEHYNKKITLQEIADFVSLTPSHLSRVIKKDTGKSFVELFNQIKIGVAEKLLKESNLKVYEVASSVGIDNYSYFYQLFKKITGIAPTDYYNAQSQA